MVWQRGRWTGQLRETPLPPPGNADALLTRLVHLRQPAALESAARNKTIGRYSLYACEPLATLTLQQNQLRGDNVTLAKTPDAIWDALSDAFANVTLQNDESPLPYAPGWIGYVGYEVGRCVETLPENAQRDSALPDLQLAFYDALLVCDHETDAWSLVELLFEGDAPPRAGLGAQHLKQAYLDSAEETAAPPCEANVRVAAATCGEFLTRSNFTPDAYRQAVARSVDYIAAGDIFQVNLSQRFTIPDAPSAPAIYRALRALNPAAYAALLTFPAQGKPCGIVSSSPELFLRSRGRHVLTRPIKGTRPRIGEPLTDAQAARDLCASPKDNAELAMIIDLLRNDLGRVCQVGSIHVTDPCQLETHPTVYHLVGTVEGTLRDDVGPADLLRATFPGGSITGAPKIRAMEIIDEIEGLARGVYTGCIGLVTVRGDCEWNIAIRTVVCEGSSAFVQAGGGIVADSTPEGEYRETLDKARALFQAIKQASQENAGDLSA